MNTKVGVGATLWFMLLVNYLDRVAMSFAGPSIMKSLAMSPATFGVVLSSFGIGYLLAQMPGGLLADKLGARILLIVGPIFWAVFTGATGLVATAAAFVIVRICFGLSEGLFNASLYKTIGDIFEPKQRSRVLAICSTALPLAPLFAGALVGKLIGAYGWQIMFFMMMGPALLAAFFSFLFIPARPPMSVGRGEPGSDEQTSFRQVLGRPSLWIFSLAALAWNIPYWGYLGWMPSYLALAHHIDLKSLGAIASIPYVFAFLGMLLGGWLGSGPMHRHCPQLIVAAFLGAGLSLFVAFQAGTAPLSLAGLCGAAFCLFGIHGPIGKVALDLAPPQYRGSYMGVYNTAGQIGGAAAPAAIGFTVSATGTFATGFGLMIVALGVAAACILGLVPFMAVKSRPVLATAP